MPAVHPHVGALVRLKVDVPAFHLRQGDEGVVICVWPAAGARVYWVEFQQPDASPPLRTLLRAEQVEIVESST